MFARAPQNKSTTKSLYASIAIKALSGTKQIRVVISAPKAVLPVQVLKHARLAIQTGQSYLPVAALVQV